MNQAPVPRFEIRIAIFSRQRNAIFPTKLTAAPLKPLTVVLKCAGADIIKEFELRRQEISKSLKMGESEVSHWNTQ